MIEAGMLVTDKMRLEEGIGEGDEVFTVGLFSKHTGSEKNLPIIRMENIVMISDEPVHTSLFGNMENAFNAPRLGRTSSAVFRSIFPSFEADSSRSYAK